MPRATTKPHVLFYGHYDVQPVDPLDLWETPPFEPRIITLPDGRKAISARGASDDKGQVMTFVEACRAWKAVTGSLPINITFLVEGAEEDGSKFLPEFIEANKDELKADVALVCDTGMWDQDTPGITSSLRGMVYEEVIVRCADRDLHSGSVRRRGAQPDPCAVEDHRGDPRRERPHHDPGLLRRRAGDADAGAGAVEGPQPHGGGVPRPGRPEAFRRREGPHADRADPVAPDLRRERHHRRLYGRGHQDRDRGGGALQDLVPPRGRPGSGEDLRELRGLRARAHSRRLLGGVHPAQGLAGARRCRTTSRRITAAKSALHDEWKKDPIVIGMGGSIPVGGDFKRTLGLDTLFVGFGLDDDRIHSPNEKYDLKSFHKGTRSWARILAALAE